MCDDIYDHSDHDKSEDMHDGPLTTTKQLGSDQGIERSQVQLRKATHKLSEKKRRKAINKRYEDLKQLLPGLNPSAIYSKQTILKKALLYIESLKDENRVSDQLIQDLIKEKETNVALKQELDRCQDKVKNLRKVRGVVQYETSYTGRPHMQN